MAYQELRGVGGWLAFLVVIMLFLSPISAVVMTAAAVHGANSPIANHPNAAILVPLFWGTVLIKAGAFCWAGWRLNSVFRASSVTTAIAVWWLAGPFLTLVFLILVFLVAGVGPDAFSAALLDLLVPIIAATLWTLYLLKSDRVRNTYFAEEWAAPTDVDEVIV